MPIAALVFAVLTVAPQTKTPEYATTRDRDVIVALARTMFKEHMFAGDGSKLLIYWRNPEYSTWIGSKDFSSKDTYPKDAWQNLIDRNCKGSKYESKPVLFSGRTFPDEFRLTYKSSDLDSFGRIFDDSLRQYAGFLGAFAPGYSADGKTALVSTWYGWDRHGSILTALLELTNGQWQVKWKSSLHFI